VGQKVSIKKFFEKKIEKGVDAKGAPGYLPNPSR
jgi:hypothetical protein